VELATGDPLSAGQPCPFNRARPPTLLFIVVTLLEGAPGTTSSGHLINAIIPDLHESVKFFDRCQPMKYNRFCLRGTGGQQAALRSHHLRRKCVQKWEPK